MNEKELIKQIPDIKSRIVVEMLYRNRPKDIPEKPKKNTWYVYRPEGAISSDGTDYYSLMRIGTANKLMILFCGGGVALDAFSAARPNELTPEEGKPTFYMKNTLIMGYIFGRSGLGSLEKKENPFRDWSVVIVQYASADFHCGTNDFAYDDPELGKGVCHHHGYLNYQAMVEKIRQFVPAPDQILVTGYSAGGFGTALLTDDVMRRFPECGDVTCLVDSSVFAYEGWHETAQNQWKAPQEICSRLTSDNLTLDCLLSLHRTHGDRVKIAFDCTYRDALLSQMQNYTDGRGMSFDTEGGDHFQKVLTEMVETLCREIPDVAIYIFDKLNPEVTEGKLTDHTIIAAEWVFDYSYQGKRFIDWAVGAVEGKPEKVGLELLGIQQ